MKTLLALVVILLHIGCSPSNESQIIEGDLYYEWLRLGNFYGQPDSVLTNFYKLKDSIGYQELIKEDSIFFYIKMLDDKNLLTSPYVYLMTDEQKKILLYIEPEEYRNLNYFTYKELIANKQKVRIVAKVDSIFDNRFMCKALVSVDLVTGETLPQRSKFKIEDYR